MNREEQANPLKSLKLKVNPKRTSIIIEREYKQDQESNPIDTLNSLGSGSNLCNGQITVPRAQNKFFFSKRLQKISFSLFICCLLAMGLYFLIIYLKRNDENENDNEKNELFLIDKNRSKEALIYFQKDKNYDQIISKLPKDLAENLQKKGFIFQFFHSSNSRLLPFTNFSNENSATKFYPINTSDHYIFTVNSTKNSKININEEEDVNDMFDSDSILNVSKKDNTAEDKGLETHIYNFSVNIADTTEDQVEIFATMFEVNRTSGSDSPDDSYLSDEETTVLDIALQYNSENKSELMNASGDHILLNLLYCQFYREGRIVLCLKPLSLDNAVYVLMLNALNLYLPNFSKKHMDIFISTSSGTTKIQTGESSNDETAINSHALNVTTDSNGYINSSSVSSNSSSNASSYNLLNLNSQTDQNKNTFIDPYTGRVLFAELQGQFQIYPTGDKNYSKADENFLKKLNANTSIALYYNGTTNVLDEEMNFYTRYFKTLPVENLTDPLEQLKNTSNNAINNSGFIIENGSNNSRMMEDSSYVVVEKIWKLIDKSYLGISFYGIIRFACFLNNHCDILLRLDIGSITLKTYLCQYINVYPLQKVYKAVSFLKVVVLDNIAKLSQLLIDIEKGIFNLVTVFLGVSLNIIDDVKFYIEKRKPDIHIKFDYVVDVMDGLLNFTTVMFPIMEQTFVQLTKDIGGLTSQEMMKEYQMYYDKSQSMNQILQEATMILQQNINFIQISDEELARIYKNTNDFINNFDKLMNELFLIFSNYGPIVYFWSKEIIANISSLMYQNDIFHFLEAIGKLSSRFPELMHQPDNAYIINGSSDEMIRSYEANLNTWNQTISFQRGLLQNSLLILLSVLNSRNYEANNVNNLDENSQKLLFEQSIILNQNLYDNIFAFTPFEILRARLDKIYINQINLKFAYLKEQYQLKYDVFKKEYFDFYDLIQKEINEMLGLVLTKESVNINNLLQAALLLFNKCKEFVSFVQNMLDKINNPNYHPTLEEINEMKKINLMKTPEYIQETYEEFQRIMTEFDKNLKLLPSQMYEITHPNNKRLLSIQNLEQYFGNIYDLIMSFVDSSYISINLVDGHIINQFFTSTQYLEIGDKSFFEYIFSNFQNQKLNFLIDHNQFMNTTLLDFVLDNSFKYLVQSGIINGLKKLLNNLIPLEGTERLLDFNCFNQISIPMYRVGFGLVSMEVDFNIGYSIIGYANWGFMKSEVQGNKTSKFFIILAANAKIFVETRGSLSFFIIKYQAWMRIDAVMVLITGEFNLKWISDGTSFHTLGNLKVDLEIFPMVFEFGVSIQYLIIRWKKIHLFWKIYIWIPRFSWSDPISWSTLLTTCFLTNSHKYCQKKKLFDEELFKTSKNSIDSFERYLINLSEMLFFDNLDGKRRLAELQ